MEMHRQCQLRRGNEHLTTWLPEKFAVKGHIVNLKNEGNWIDGWEVVGVLRGWIRDRLVSGHRIISTNEKVLI